MSKGLVMALLCALTVNAQEPGKCTVSSMVRAMFIASELLRDRPATTGTQEADAEPDQVPVPLFPPAASGVPLTDEERWQRLTWLSWYGHTATRVSAACVFYPLPWLVPDERNLSAQNATYRQPGTYCWNGKTMEPMRAPLRSGGNARDSPTRGRQPLLDEFNQLARLCGIEKQ